MPRLCYLTDLLHQGLAYFVAPFAGFSLQRWPAQRKKASIFGLVLILISLLAASYATSVAQLILTQGVLYGIGGSLLYNPFLFYLDEWFIRRKGMAYGVFFSGTGLAGSFIPAILQWGLDNYGFQLTLQIWALVVVRFGLSLSPLVLYPLSHHSPQISDSSRNRAYSSLSLSTSSNHADPCQPPPLPPFP